jgi:flagellar biosynthesis protein FliR
VARRLFLADAAHHGADLHRPILSEKSIPKRVKVGLGIIISIIVAPLPPVDIPIFSANAVWVALQQVMIGVAVGFTMQLAFAAVRTAGADWPADGAIVRHVC